QMTTLGENITAVEMEGNFDDCQRIVKTALRDPDIAKKHVVTSANSINIARLIPQCFYYFYADSQLAKTLVRRHDGIVFSVPSGNFGNLAAGLIAHKMGLQSAQFVAATNRNNVIPQFLQTGVFEPRASIPTLSSAMDVGDPSNFARIQALYNGEVNE